MYWVLKLYNSDWDLNPRGGARTQSEPRLGLEPHCLLIEITHLVSGLNEALVLDVSLQKEFSERQSDRSEVGLFRQIHTP